MDDILILFGMNPLDGGVFYTGFGILGYLIMRVCVMEIIFFHDTAFRMVASDLPPFGFFFTVTILYY